MSKYKRIKSNYKDQVFIIMGETTSSLEKLLNTTIKHKFPNVVDRIDVKEEELDSFSYLLKVYVIINNYNKIKFEPEIREYIEQVSKYILKPQGKVVNQIIFGMEI